MAVCRAHRPFWIRFTQQLSLPLTLWSQSVDGEWQMGWAQRYFEAWLEGRPLASEGLGEIPEHTLGDLLRAPVDAPGG